jgi:hypothetical protein
MKLRSQLLIALIFGCTLANAQVKSDYKLPGKGLKQYDFLYAGEWDLRKPTAQSMFLVKGGKVVWQYSIPMFTATSAVQEFADATLLNNGNIVYACMSGAGVITPEKILYGSTPVPKVPKHIRASLLARIV